MDMQMLSVVAAGTNVAADAAVPVQTAPQPIDPAPKSQPIDPTTAPAPEPTVPPSRLLQKLAAGHFNPVAALRLRMNHAEEIKAAGLELGEPAAARGKGTGYEKALEAYRAANPAPAPVPTTPTTPTTGAAPVDAVA